MKKVLFALLAVLMIAMMIAPSVTAAADRGKVLVVHGTAAGVAKGDQAIGDRLKKLGFGTVDYKLAKDTTDTSWKGYNVVFIGESVTSADVATKFTKAECYVICGEPGLWDELLIGNYNSTYDTAAYKGKYTVKSDVMKSGLTTFDGFKADATPGFLKEWGKGVTVLVENADKAPAVTYAAKGAEMFDGSKAVGARSTIFCRGQSAADFTDDTWKLFDALINYVLPVPVETTQAAATTAKAAATTAKAAATTKAAQTADLSIVMWVMAAGAAVSAGTLTFKKHR